MSIRVCTEWAEHSYEQCDEWEDRGYETCDEWEDQGYEADWRHADGGRRLASYTSLPPGDYRFLVQGGDGSGGWADNRAELHVRVLPFWYQTTWARGGGAMAVLALGVVWLLFRWRTR